MFENWRKRTACSKITEVTGFCTLFIFGGRGKFGFIVILLCWFRSVMVLKGSTVWEIQGCVQPCG